mgnify:CR=1 FL=1
MSAGLGEVDITEAASLEEALLSADESFDLVLLDVQLEGINGLDGIALLKRKWPCAKVLMVSATQDTHIRVEALKRGALGFISKSEPPSRMLELVGQVLAGLRPMHARQESAAALETSVRLSPRQHEVLELLGLGLPNKLIGRRLNVTENTVRGHVGTISVSAETVQTMKNVAAQLATVGASLSDIVKTTCFLTDLENFTAFNEDYAAALGNHRPARSTVAVAGLPAGFLVEVEAWAYVPQG